MNNDNATTNTSLFSGLGLALLGTTCCALPIVLVTSGMGSVAASVVSALPSLAWLSQYKGITFSITAIWPQRVPLAWLPLALLIRVRALHWKTTGS